MAMQVKRSGGMAEPMMPSNAPKLLMNHSRMVGFSFGLVSGVITTMGMMVGLNASTESALAVVGGIIAIAIADAFSDAMGIHVSEESELKHTARQIWESTVSTFATKLAIALTFIVPVLLLPLGLAVAAGVIWGLLIIIVFSAYIARLGKTKVYRAVGEHLAIAVAVVILTYVAGKYVNSMFV